MSNIQRAVDNLLRLVNELLILPNQAGLVKPITDRVAELCYEITGISGDDDMNNWHDVKLNKGVAISPVQAAKCTKEMLRTQIFIKGINEAFKSIQNTQEKKHILYAGTGPFGILVLPLLALSKDPSLRVSLIDIHPENIDATQKMIEALGIQEAIQAVYCDDACHWGNPENLEFDFIISETMNTLLRREPQVSIFCHLQQFLAPSGEFIPQSIVLDAWLLHDDLKIQGQHIGTFFCLNKLEISKLANDENDPAVNHKTISGALHVPEASMISGTLNAFHTLKLTTHIHVFADHWLRDNESSLNMPTYYKNLDIKPGSQINFRYKTEPLPEFIFDVPEYVPNADLVNFQKTGRLGIYHLQRFWQKTQLDIFNKLDKHLQACEWPLDELLIKEVGGTLQQWLTYFYQPHLAFDDAESWVEKQCKLRNEQQIKQFNNRLEMLYRSLE